MDIYFACSITGGRQDEIACQSIVHTLISNGHSVPTAHLAQPDAASHEAIIPPEEVYSRDTNWIKGCQVLVAEVSTPSHGVGYEIAYALHLGKAVLCCYREGVRVSKMILGNPDPNLHLRTYRDPAELIQTLHEFLAEIAS
jgi:nucleoside 2-deoxyribosyltransferase